jgi:hypothetical protein
MFQLDFEASSEDSQREYATIFSAINLTQRQTAVAEWADVAGLIKALKSIGKDSGESVGGAPVFILDRDGPIYLERGEQRLLVDYLKQPIWRPHVIEQIQELVKKVEGAKEHVGSLKPDARPEAKKRAMELVGDAKDGE